MVGGGGDGEDREVGGLEVSLMYALSGTRGPVLLLFVPAGRKFPSLHLIVFKIQKSLVLSFNGCRL